MSTIEDEPDETVVEMARLSDTEPQRTIILNELQRRGIGRTASLAEMIIDSDTGVYDAVDGTPDAPRHDNESIWPSIN